jgi:YbgC/YbaW family acyl-CoA thioester hydrolase
MSGELGASGGRSGPVRHREQIKVLWADTDASGRIHHTAAFRWAENAEHALLQGLGLTEVRDLPRRQVTATYHRPLVFDDVCDLELEPTKVGRTSISYAWRIHRDGELCIEGTSVVVHVGPDGKPAPLPDAMRAGLTIA